MFYCVLFMLIATLVGLIFLSYHFIVYINASVKKTTDRQKVSALCFFVKIC